MEPRGLTPYFLVQHQQVAGHQIMVAVERVTLAVLVVVALDMEVLLAVQETKEGILPLKVTPVALVLLLLLLPLAAVVVLALLALTLLEMRGVLVVLVANQRLPAHTTAVVVALGVRVQAALVVRAAAETLGAREVMEPQILVAGAVGVQTLPFPVVAGDQVSSSSKSQALTLQYSLLA